VYGILTLLGAIVLLAVFQHFYAAQNYLDPNAPFFSGSFAAENETTPEDLTILSYNISYGRSIDRALIEIKEFQSQKMLDILLLQEMEEVGVERMARELRMDYVYFPAAIEPKYRRNFGNAVLSRWPIVEAQKIILPHISLSDRMKRVAARAIIKIHDVQVVAYSLHTEPVFILSKFKEDQCFAVLNDRGSQARFVMVGGDFNSFTERYGEKLEKRYRQAGFIRASKGSGHTFTRFGMKMSTDQIFAKGFVVKAAGRLSGARASDHLPIWATLGMDTKP
jgi:endonuclease/exonuclease/phosphatase family metal-dependent hydrolase